MKHRTGILMLLLLPLFQMACKKVDPPQITLDKLSKIELSEAGVLRNGEGEIFIPWGLNYTNPWGLGLIEDHWHKPDIFQIITQDFAEMKALSANVVRIHLQYHQFMLDPWTPNDKNLSKLKDLVNMAENTAIYLDVTGLAAYRQEDQPEFYAQLSDEERWNTHAIFWKSIAEAIGSSPAIYSYNLMNEPVVSVKCDLNSTCSWLPGEPSEEFYFVQNITREPNLPFLITMKDWIDEMTDAIRSVDKTTLITYGSLALGDYCRFSDDLDLLSIHLYPKSNELDKSIDYLTNHQCSKPIILEEIYNLRCNINELQNFINAVEGKYDGLFGHYYGTPLNGLNSFIIKEALQKNFLQFFIDNNPNLK